MTQSLSTMWCRQAHKPLDQSNACRCLYDTSIAKTHHFLRGRILRFHNLGLFDVSADVIRPTICHRARPLDVSESIAVVCFATADMVDPLSIDVAVEVAGLPSQRKDNRLVIDAPDGPSVSRINHWCHWCPFRGHRSRTPCRSRQALRGT